MLIKGDNKTRGKWNIGIVTDFYPGVDGEVRAQKLKKRINYQEEFLSIKL